MIIVSQDKKTIYNFDNVKSIDVLENEIYIADDILANEGARIAEYATEERAKEVIEDIIDKYEDIQILKYSRESFATRDNFVYRMPKE